MQSRMDRRCFLGYAAALAAVSSGGVLPVGAEEIDRKGRKPVSFGFATWNIGHFALGLKSNSVIAPADVPKRAADYRRFLDSAKADVVGLCEYVDMFSSDKKVRTEATAFADYAGREIGPSKSANQNGFYWKTGIRKVSAGLFDFPVRRQPRYCQWVRLLVGGCEICLVETHCDFKAAEPGRESERVQQMRFLVEKFGSEPRVVIAGDFNNSYRDPKTNREIDLPVEFDIFRKAGFSAAHWGELKTWPSRGPTVGIDNVFVKGLSVSDAKVLSDKTLSDHSLLRCTLTEKRKEAVS